MKNSSFGTESILKNNDPIDKLETYIALERMLKSQSESLIEIKNNLKQIKIIVELIIKKLKRNKTSRMIYVGAGTSARIAVQDGVELYPTFGWPKARIGFLIAGGMKALTNSIEGAEDNILQAKKDVEKNNIRSSDIIIGLAASSNTPYTVSVIRECKKIKALTIGIGNNSEGKLQKYAEHSITLNTGPEIIAGSTRLKAGTAQKICLNLISTMIMVRLGFVKDGLMSNLVASNKKLIHRKKIIDKMLLI